MKLNRKTSDNKGFGNSGAKVLLQNTCERFSSSNNSIELLLKTRLKPVPNRHN